MQLNVVLASIDTPPAEAWQRFCGGLPGVTIHRGSILDVQCDAVVSPANSFGFMDGGIDLSYARHFGWKLEQRLQELIRAALLLIKHGQFREGPFAGARVDSVVRTVAFPGLGTGVGKVGPNICARQVRAAIEDVVLERTSFPRSWADAQSRHQLLYGNRFRDLQRE